MATWTVYTSKAKLDNASNPATVKTTPVATGITVNDAVAFPFGNTVPQFLAALQRTDTDGFNYSASSDAGATFVQPSDKGGY